MASTTVPNIEINAIRLLCSQNSNGIPTISNNTAKTNHRTETSLLYLFTSLTSGAFTFAQNSTGFFDNLAIIPITKNVMDITLQIINAITISLRLPDP